MKMTKKKLVAILLCCVMLFAVYACGNDKNAQDTGTSQPAAQPSGGGGSSSAPAPASGGSSAAPGGGAQDSPGQASSGRDTLIIGVADDTGSLDPPAMSGSGGFLALATAYTEPLLNHDVNMNPIWLLATGIDEVTPTQWTVHVREGVTFSNGNPLTAEDVLFTLLLYRDTPQRALNVQSLDLDNSKVIDDHTLDLRLTSYNVAQMTMLSAVLIVNKASYDPVDFSLNPVGTGPYVVTDYVVNSHVYMTARDDYWGNTPAIKNLTFKVLTEDSQKTIAIETGTVDYIQVPSQDISYVEGLSGYNVELIRIGQAIQVLFSVDPDSPFADVEARYAVCHAVDRDAIINLVYNGYATVTNYPVTMAALDFEPRLENLHDTYSVGYNVDLAKQYAERSGLVNKDVRIMTNGAPAYVAMAEILQANLKNIRVNAIIDNRDQATLRSVYRSDASAFDICLYFTSAPTLLAADILNANVRFSTILMEGHWPGFERFAELSGGVLSNPDPKVRSDMFYEMVQIFDNAALWYGVCDVKAAYAYSSDLRGVVFNPLGSVRYQDWSFG